MIAVFHEGDPVLGKDGKPLAFKTIKDALWFFYENNYELYHLTYFDFEVSE